MSPTGLGSSLPSRSTSSASSNAGLCISELSGGSPGLVMPTHSAGSIHYPAPASNGSSTTSSNAGGHFQVNQTLENGQQFTGWVASSGHDSVLSLDSNQYGSVPSGTANGGLYLAETQEGHQISWTSAPECLSTSKGVKKGTNSSGIKMAERQNSKTDSTGTNSKIPSPSMPPTAVVVVKSTKKTKPSKIGHVHNGKAAVVGASTKNNGNSKKTAADSSVGANNDGLTTQQLELIQEIMRQTQEQHRLMQEEQQLIQHKPAQPSHHSSSGPAKAKKANNKVKWTSPPPSSANNSDVNQSTPANSLVGGDATPVNGAVSGRPVECNVCQRRFKNTPALNGHMRLHGGFLKKEAECGGSSGSANGSGGGGNNNSGGGGGTGGGSSKKPGESKKDPNTPPLLTASVSVRALIEEKIIQRRNNMAANNSSSASSSSASTLSTTLAPLSTSSASSVVVQQQQEQHSHALPISVQVVNPPEASVILMDVLEEDQTDSVEAQSQQTLVPKLEPEGYFEGKYDLTIPEA